MRSLKLMLMILLIPAAVLSCDKAGDEPLGGVPTENRMPGLGEVAPAVAFEAPEADLGDLIPKDAFGVLYVPSAKGLVDKMAAMVKRVDPEAAGEMQLDQVLDEMLGDMMRDAVTADMVDTSRPLALAMILKERRGEQRPLPVLILPVKDVAAATASLAQNERKPSYAAAGDYVAACPMPDLQLGGGGSKLLGDMPAGDIVVRLDLAALIDAFGADVQGEIEQGLRGGMRDAPPGMEGIGDFIEGAMQDLLDSAEGLDLCVRLGDEMVDLHCFFTAKEGSPLGSASAPSGDILNLAGCLPSDYPLSVLLSADMSKFMEWMEPLMEASLGNMPPDAAEKFGEFWKKSMGLSSGLGSELAMAMDFGENGIQMVEVFTAKDAQKYLADMEGLMSEDIAGVLRETGMEMTIGAKTQVAGREVHNWTMTIDPEKLMASQPGAGEIPPEQIEAMRGLFERLMGKGGMHWRMAAVGNRIVATMSDDDVLEKALAAAGASDVGPAGTLNDAVSRIGATPKFLLHMDLRTFASQILDMVRSMMPPQNQDEIPEIPDGGAIPLTVYYTGNGRNHAMGTSVNLGRILDMVKHIQNQK